MSCLSTCTVPLAAVIIYAHCATSMPGCGAKDVMEDAAGICCQETGGEAPAGYLGSSASVLLSVIVVVFVSGWDASKNPVN